LLLFDEILLEVQSQATTRSAEGAFGAARDCANALDHLAKLIDELKAQICKPGTGGAARRMQELVEAGSSNARLLKASFSSASEKEVGLMIGAIGAITRQIHEAAEEVETECEVVLTTEGKKKLLEIFETVKTVRPIAEKVRLEQEKWGDKVKTILCQVKAVQRNMFGAAIASSKEDIKKMDEYVDVAICFLKKLDDKAIDPGLAPSSVSSGNLPIPSPKPSRSITPGSGNSTPPHEAPKCDESMDCEPDYHPPPPGRAAEVLMGLLRGTQIVAKNPAAGYFEVSQNSQGNKGSLFVASSDRRLAMFPAPHVGDLLERYCRPYTYVRRALLTTAVGIARAAHPAGSAERVRAINWIVYKLKCDEGANREQLAIELAA